MDQLRKAWGWLQRQHFWVLTVVAIAVALGCWWSGASALLAEYKANQEQDRSRIHGRRARCAASRSMPNDEVQAAQNAANRRAAKERQRAVEAALRSADGRGAQVAEQPERRVSQVHREAEVRRRHSAESARPLQQLHPRPFSRAAEDRRRARRSRTARAGGGGMGRGGGGAFQCAELSARAGATAAARWRPEGEPAADSRRRARLPRRFGPISNWSATSSTRGRRPRRSGSGRRRKICGSTKRCCRSSPTRTRRPVRIGFRTRRCGSSNRSRSAARRPRPVAAKAGSTWSRRPRPAVARWAARAE